MSLTNMFLHVTGMHPDRIALMEDGHSVTYRELADCALHLAGTLRHHGVEPGDRVALLGAPTVVLGAWEVACIAAGAVPVVVDHALTPTEARIIVDDAAPRVAVVGPGAGGQPLGIDVQTLDSRCSDAGESAWSRLLHYASERPALTAWYRAQPEELALLIYTGGTTGRPKGVMHTHASVMSWMNMNPPRGWGSRAENFRCLIANLTHCSGQHNLWSTFAQGGTGVLPGPVPLTADYWVDMIEQFRITYAGLLGNLAYDVLHLPNLPQRDLRSIELVSHGGAPAHPDTLRRLVNVFAHAIVVEGYAQTEGGLTMSLANLTKLVRGGADNARLSTVGTPELTARSGQVPQDIRIIGPNGCEAKPGVVGEVICRGPQVMAGYWRNPNTSAEVMRDGWLHTGDIGHVDADGFLYLDGRSKDMIKIGALSVYPTEIEVVIAAHPAVADVTVIGLPVEEGGDAVAAVVVPVVHRTIELDELRAFCQASLASFKLPTKLYVVDSLPRNATGKVLKRELRDRFTNPVLKA